MRNAFGDAGAGKVENYKNCSFSYVGVGRFTPTEGANPTIGTIDSPQQVTEESIEVVCERGDTKRILAALRGVHPYEEPAYEIYELLDEDAL